MLAGTGRPPRAGGDAGHTLVELAVALTLTAFVLATVTSVLTRVIQAYTHVQDHSLAEDRGRVLLDRFDGELRWASSVNAPAVVGGRSYLEYRRDVTPAGTPATCTQWRYDPAVHVLQVRSWAVGATQAPGWSTVLTGIVNDPVAEPVFTLTPPGVAAAREQVTLRLRLTLTRGQATTTATLAARNSSTPSPSGQDLPVCLDFGRP